MCLNVLSLDKIERSFIDKRAIEWSDLNESMFDVYDSGNDGAYCHSINKRETFVSQKKCRSALSVRCTTEILVQSTISCLISSGPLTPRRISKKCKYKSKVNY
jgi:hypothetical protein